MCRALTDHVVAKSLRNDEGNHSSGSEDDTAGGKSKPSACDAETALFLAKHFCASEDNTGKALIHVHKACF